MSYLLSPDVLDPKQKVKILNPADGSVAETRVGGLEFDHIETDDSGISRLVMVDGTQVEQYPRAHASFSFVAGNGVYGRCAIDGALCGFKTRPEDPAYVYTIARLP
jgi:hypothetical protein